MTFIVTRTSDMFDKYDNAFEIELISLEELMDWINKQNAEVIISKDQTIEIYDDWRE